MERLTIQVGPYGVNCSLLAHAGRAWIVDPGQEAERIVELLEGNGLEPAAVLLTHAHFDHVGGIPGLQKAFPGLPVYMHPKDRPVLTHPMNQFPPDYPAIGAPLNLADATEFADIGACVIETPGHTPGGVCYHFAEDGLLLSGDTLFAGSVGRTDLPGGDMPTLMGSLKKLTALPDDTLVIPGHGPHTTIGAERRGNPFLRTIAGL